MSVSIEEVGPLERRLTVTIPGASIEAEVARRLEELRKTAKVRGFRPGKAPVTVVRQQYGGTVRAEVIDEMKRSRYAEAVSGESLSPAAAPSFGAGQSNDEGDYVFTAEVEVYPDFEARGLDSLKAVKPRIEISGADVDEVIERLRRQRKTWHEVARAAAQGDRVVIDFEGRIEGQPFEGNRASELPVVIGAGEVIPGFEEGLVGISSGESRVLDLRFPDDYRKQELAGRPVRFEITARRVEQSELPALDDAFAAEFGVAAGGLAQLRERVQASMAAELDEKVTSELRRQLGESLLESNPIAVPQGLVEEEVMRQQQATLRRLGIATEGSRTPKLPREPFVAEAERRVRLGLVLSQLIRQEALSPEPGRVERRIRELTAGAEDPGTQERRIRADNQLMRRIEAQVLEDMAYDWLLERAAVEEEPKSFFEYMEPEQSDGERSSER